MSERTFPESRAEAQIRKYGRVLPNMTRKRSCRSKYDGRGGLVRTKYGEGRR